jgi:PAS domain S-box-containing protein
MPDSREEENLLRSAAMQNARSILLARQQNEQNLLLVNKALESKTQELAYSLSMMSATLESTTDGILVTDVVGKVTGYNERYVQMWRIPRDVLMGAEHWKILEDYQRFKDSARERAHLDQIYGTSPLETFDLLELADGRIFERFSTIQRVEEQVVGRVWSYRDITERRRTEEALREERLILELLNRTGAAIASTLDLQTLVQCVTDAGTALSGANWGAFYFKTPHDGVRICLPFATCGASREDIEGIGPSLVTPLFEGKSGGHVAVRYDDLQKEPEYAELSAHGRSYLSVPAISRSGQVIGGLFFLHKDAGVFDERDERLIVAVAAQAAMAIDNARLYEVAKQDAEERERLLESERSARAAAERMGELKDEFLANLSHELRTPLSAIIGWSKVLRQGVKDVADLHNGLETIERNAHIQARLIDDLLDMNRIASGKLRLDMQPVAPITFIQAAIGTVRPAADAKGIRIEKFLDPAAAPISGDSNRLQQVVWNLLSNAIKFTSKGGKVTVVLSRRNSHIEITVTDTGIGIKPEFLAHVFERFRQEEAATNRRFGGLGLGLSIVKQLVELHGGTVGVKSPGEGQGATFTVQLPLMEAYQEGHDPHLNSESMQNRLPEFPSINLAEIKILVVDDDPDARDLIRRVLTNCAAQVLTAGSAADALALVENERPHVMLSDIGMPDIDGYELLKRVRSLGRAKGGTLPAIALTAFARSEDRTRALRSGFLVHISKPVEPSELIATVASVVGRNETDFPTP